MAKLLINLLEITDFVDAEDKTSDQENVLNKEHQADQADQADLADQTDQPSVSQKKVLTPMKEILTFFNKEKSYTKDEALRLIGLVSNYSTRQVYDVCERLAFEGAIKIQKNINSKK